jgi:BASS family bile acid:Na+ symporter
MLGTGMTLEKSDFTQILTSKEQRTSIPIGVLCQFMLMPLSASIIGRALLLPYHDPTTMAHLGKHLFLGLVLVGCSPGGTASNLVSLIAGADVALSVLLTACSTVLASVVTPLLTKFIVGSAIPVSGKALCLATAKVVLLPVAFGVFLNEYFPRLCRQVSRWTPFASVLLVSLICGGVVSNNASMWAGTSVAAGGALSIPMLILLSVISTHILGFAAGYLVPKVLFRFPERTARTISIETGMQNSALAVVLAKSIGADPLSFLPGALSATAHSCLGSALAAFWRMQDARKENGQ